MTRNKLIIDIILEWSQHKPDQIALSFIDDNCECYKAVSYAELVDAILICGSWLVKHDYLTHEVVIISDNTFEFVAGFLGCLLVGATAVPVPSLKGKKKADRTIAIIESLQNPIVLNATLNNCSDKLKGYVYSDLASVLANTQIDIALESFSHKPDDIAYLQFTSGSTSAPKGVMITHDNIMHNEACIFEAFGHSQTIVVLGWLPFFHDMGLIGNLLQPLYCGAQGIYFRPEEFLNNPILWLEAISRYQVTTSGGPNFSYDLCVDHLKNTCLDHLDLSQWRLAFNGSEFIKKQTINRFSQAFKQFGFSKNAFYACYGLAESCLFVTGRHLNEAPEAESDFICLGKPPESIEVVITDSNKPYPPYYSGEILVSSKSVSPGYYRNCVAKSETFKADILGQHYLRTGDIGWLDRNGYLFFMGRKKEVIIINGENYYINDLLLPLQSRFKIFHSPQLMCVSAEQFNKNSISILVEVSDRKTLEEADMYDEFINVSKLISDYFSLKLWEVVFVGNGRLPRTTSGKVQFFKCQQRYNEDRIRTILRLKATQVINQRTQDSNFREGVKQLISFIESVLDRPIYTNTTIGNLGLDSLEKVRLYHAIEKSYGVQLGSLNNVTLKDLNYLADRIGRAAHKGSDRSAQNFPLCKTSTLLPQQLNILAHELSTEAKTQYLIPVLIKFQGEPNPAKLNDAFKKLCYKHIALRSYICQNNGQWQQVLCDKVVELEILDDEITEDAYQKVLSLPFDVENELPVRGHLFKNGTNWHLVLVFHHTAIDGWSFNILKRDFEYFYKNPNAAPQPDPSVYYYNEINNQHSKDESERYWRDYFADIEMMPVSFYNQVSKQSDTKPRYFELSLSIPIVNRLKYMVSTTHFTLAQILLTAYHIILQWYTKEPTTIVGYAAANREDPLFSETVGCFVNTLVGKLKVSFENDFMTHLKSVSSDMVSSSQHQSYPYRKIIDLARDLENPAYSKADIKHFFVMQNAPHEKIALDDNVIGHIELPKTAASMFDLVLNVNPKNYVLTFEHQDSIPSKVVETFGYLYCELLDELLLNQEASLQSLRIWQKNYYPYCIAKRINQDFCEHIFNNLTNLKDTVAIVDETGSTTYSMLLDYVNRVSEKLLECYVNQNERVVIYQSRRAWFVASVLASLKLKATYIPIDPSYSPEMAEEIITTVKPTAVITDQVDIAFSNKIIVPIITAEYNQAIPSDSILNPEQTHIAYIMLTSGSTSDAKLVAMSYSSLNCFLSTANDVLKIASDSTVLQFSSLSWDTSSEEIFPALIAGGSIVMKPSHNPMGYKEIVAYSSQYGVTVWNLPSSYWSGLHNYLSNNSVNYPNTLQTIIVGGEPCDPTLVNNAMQYFRNSIQFINTYGLTEMCSISLSCDLNNTYPDNISNRHVPIGKPIANTKVIIEDSWGRNCPLGVIGELKLSSPQKFIGYAQATGEELIIDHYESEFYATGDLVYFDSDSNIYHVGRKKGFIKRRGVRIDLKMLQDKLISTFEHNGIIALSHVHNTIIVFIKSTLNLDYSDVWQKIKKSLPSYYYPDYIQFIKHFPRLINGKIDAKSLIQSFSKNTFPEVSGISEERNDDLTTSSDLSKIWTKVLGHDAFTESSNFFEVGGNSLNILYLQKELEHSLETKIDVGDLFRYPAYIDQLTHFYPDRDTAHIDTDYQQLSETELLEKVYNGDLTFDQVRDIID